MFVFIVGFFFNDPATTEIYTYLHTLSLHDALPIYRVRARLVASSSFASPRLNRCCRSSLSGQRTQRASVPFSRSAISAAPALVKVMQRMPAGSAPLINRRKIGRAHV